MRLIDADEFEKRISEYNTTDITDSILYNFAHSKLISMPTVENKPQQKTGHWIEEIDDYGKVIGWHCDQCYEDSGFTTDCKWDFCPSCGAKMVESQERGDEE